MAPLGFYEITVLFLIGSPVLAGMVATLDMARQAEDDMNRRHPRCEPSPARRPERTRCPTRGPGSVRGLVGQTRDRSAV